MPIQIQQQTTMYTTHINWMYISFTLQDGTSALHKACEADGIELIKLLIEKGSSVLTITKVCFRLLSEGTPSCPFSDIHVPGEYVLKGCIFPYRDVSVPGLSWTYPQAYV